MEKSFFISSSFAIIFMMMLISTPLTYPLQFTPQALAEEAPTALPLPPDTALSQAATSSTINIKESTQFDTLPNDASIKADEDTPIRIIIPSIKLDTMIVGVGLNAKGEMDVPSGKTKNVGWYEDGTTPGKLGSAVLDAHVFAAFNHLREITEGADVYVIQGNGSKLHFQVTHHKVYPLADVPLQRLFLAHDAKHLNLITCAGSLTRDHSTYDHRLIVYTTLVEDAGE